MATKRNGRTAWESEISNTIHDTRSDVKKITAGVAEIKTGLIVLKKEFKSQKGRIKEMDIKNDKDHKELINSDRRSNERIQILETDKKVKITLRKIGIWILEFIGFASIGAAVSMFISKGG